MAGFFKRIFSFGRDDRAGAAPETVPEEAPEAVPEAVPDEVAPETAPEPARTDAPAEDGLVARGEGVGEGVGKGVVTERPLDAGRGPDPCPLPESVEPEAVEPDAAPAPVHRTDDPGDGLDPAASPVEPSNIAGGTVTGHATQDAVALEEADALPPAGGTPEAGRADPEADPEADPVADGADGDAPTH